MCSFAYAATRISHGSTPKGRAPPVPTWLQGGSRNGVDRAPPRVSGQRMNLEGPATATSQVFNGERRPTRAGGAGDRNCATQRKWAQTAVKSRQRACPPRSPLGEWGGGPRSGGGVLGGGKNPSASALRSEPPPHRLRRQGGEDGQLPIKPMAKLTPSARITVLKTKAVRLCREPMRRRRRSAIWTSAVWLATPMIRAKWMKSQ